MGMQILHQHSCSVNEEYFAVGALFPMPLPYLVSSTMLLGVLSHYSELPEIFIAWSLNNIGRYLFNCFYVGRYFSLGFSFC